MSRTTATPAALPRVPARSRGQDPRPGLPIAVRRLAVRALSVAVGLLAWHFACAWRLDIGIRFAHVPAPLDVASEFVRLVGEDALLPRHLGASLRRIAVSFALAAGLGVLAGLLMGRYRMAEDILSPHLELLRPIPAVAWIPLAIVMLPTEESSILFITFLGAFFPIVLNTIHGVRQIPEALVRAARSLGAPGRSIFLHVVLPGALPSIATGLAIGMGVSWFSLLAAEIISGQYGIGYFTWVSYTLVQYPRIVIGMLAIGMLGTFSTWAVRQMTRPLLRWQERGR